MTNSFQKFDDALRAQTLHDYSILDTPPEAAFDRLTRIASDIFQTRVSLVSFIDNDRQWFKSRVGLDAIETPRAWAFCDHAIREMSPLVVLDATADARFADNPLVTGGPEIRFYAGAPLFTPNGAAVGTLCIIDPTPRHEFSVPQLTLLQDFAAIVVDEMELRYRSSLLLKELQERKETEAKLLAAYKSKSEFLASLSHELRSPLNAVIGFASIIETQELGDVSIDAYSECAKDIKLSGLHLLSVINDVLDYSKSEVGAVVLSCEMILIDQFFEETLRIVRGFAQKGEVELQTRFPSAELLIYADKSRLRQVFLNLLTNAIKFTPKGGSVTVQVESRGEHVHIQVIDTGMGISPAEIDKVLTPFSQSAAGIASGTGTGLGLPIAKALVERHGGQFFIRSTEAVGTVAEAILPLTALGDSV